jgi:DNA-binding transcriptional ArsR family regulator
MLPGMKQPRHPQPEDLTLTRALAALSDPARLSVVTILSDGRERGWGEFHGAHAKSTLSHHMRVLREAGITQTRMEGTRCFVTLRSDFERKFPGLLAAILSHAASSDRPDSEPTVS